MTVLRGRVPTRVATALVPVLVSGLISGLVAGCSSGRDVDRPSGPSTSAGAAALRFLKGYVTDDGRVLRKDQGNDIVSEGQAYAMLIAELAGRDQEVRTIWSWTRDHLQRDDGLLSYHADAQGNVIDEAFATDADILAAYALLRYDGDDSDELDEDGQRLADAVLAHAVAATDAGPVPIAGPWAKGPPAVVNPSYWMPGVATQLARLTDDDRWRDLAEASVSLLRDATHDGADLPTDWARLDGSVLEPGGAPDGSAPAQYGPDAQRVPIFLAYGCVDGAADLAKAWWHRLGVDGASGATVLSPDGAVIDGNRSPLAMLAAAAAARVAGHDGRARDLTAQADEQARSTPTYYGDAWVALAAGLADGSLVSC